MELKVVLEKLSKKEITSAEAKLQIQQILAKKKGSDESVHNPSLIKTNSRLSLEDVQRYVIKVAAQILKFENFEIQLQEPFENYGIDSIVSMRIVDAFERDLGTLSKTLFFEYRNFEELSLYFFDSFHEPLCKILCSDLEVKISERAPVEPSLVFNKPESHLPISVSSSDSMDIAIIGLSGKYPKSPNIQIFWENLKQGFNGIGLIPLDRWDASKFYDPKKTKLGTICTNLGGFIDGVDEFDDLLFKVLPIEAKILDPQDRLFLQGVWEALEDAGYTRESIALKTGGDVGVYAGVMTNDYSLLSASNAGQTTDAFSNGITAEVANRTSYFFDFQGPSITLNTMCSSSLTSIFLACESLKHRQTRLAIAGGVNLTLHPNKYLVLSDNKFLSSDGLCKSFGEGGKGYIPSEGCGVAVLKLLSEALQDNDHIYGVIKGASINNCGRSSRYRVPMAKSQAKVIEKALTQANIDPSTITYIEAHGTGTELGDPIEIDGLTEVFRKKTVNKQFCSIGSVKSNIGHTEGAAGIASLTKVLLQMKHKTLAPSIHSEKTNPNIHFEESPFYLQKKCQPWNLLRSEIPRRAGISSFGAGGSNAYILVEEYQQNNSKTFDSSPLANLFILSAANQKILKIYVEKIINFLHLRSQHPDYISEFDFQARMSYTFQVGRESMNSRLAIDFTDLNQLGKELKNFCSGKLSERCLSGETNSTMAQATYSYSESHFSIDTLKKAWIEGKQVKWDEIWGKSKPLKLSAPTYPFERRKFWISDKPLIFNKDVEIPKKSEDDVSKIENFPFLIATPTWILENDFLSSKVEIDKTILIYPLSNRSLIDRLRVRKETTEIFELPDCQTARDTCEGLQKLSSYMQKILKEKRYKEANIFAIFEESDYLKYSYIYGFFLSLSLEKPQFKTKIIRIGIDGEDTAKEHIEKEWGSKDSMILYEEKKRKCLTFQTILEEEGVRKSLTKDGGVYWILGGLGGLGQIFARNMSRTEKNITIVLSGRSQPDYEKLQKLKEEINLGTVLTYEPCDVTQDVSVEQAVKKLINLYGKIDGIIHAGGVIKDSWLIRKNLDLLSDVINPKILGVNNLDEATKHLKLDFMIFCSSEAAVFGNIGQTDYAAANSYMDSFAEWRAMLQQKGMRSGKTLSVNWPYWKEGGMKISEEAEKIMFETTGEVPLQTKTGVDSLDLMLGLNQSQALIVQGDVEKIRSVFAILPPSEKKSYNKDIPYLLQTARNLFSEVSQIPDSEIQDNVAFQDYGADSVTFGDLSRAFSAKFEVPVDIPFFFENPNLQEVAKALAILLNESIPRIEKPVKILQQENGDWVELTGEKKPTFRTILNGKEPFFCEHRLVSRPLLPAAFYLESLMKLGQNFLKGPISIEECTFKKGLFYEGKPNQLFLTFSGDSEETQARFWTFADNGAEIELVVARIKPYQNGKPKYTLQSLGTFKHILSPQKIYALLKEIGFDYGPSFRSVKEVSVYPEKLFCTLELPDGSNDDLMFPYPLIDGALQSLVGFQTVENDAENAAPFYFKGICVYKKFSKKTKVIIHKINNNQYRLEFYNDEDELIAEFEMVETILMTREKKKYSGQNLSHMEKVIKEKVSEITLLPIDAIALELPLMQLGLGNLEAIRLQNELKSIYKVSPPFELFRKSTNLQEFIQSFELIINNSKFEDLVEEVIDDEIANISNKEAEALLEMELK